MAVPEINGPKIHLKNVHHQRGRDQKDEEDGNPSKSYVFHRRMVNITTQKV